MNQRSDAFTVALTGQLPFILVIAAVLAFVASFLILRLYRRSVIKSMRRRGTSELLQTKGYLPPEPEQRSNDAPLSFHFVARRQIQREPTPRNCIAAPAAAVGSRPSFIPLPAFVSPQMMTAAFLSAGKMEFLPFRFAYLTWINFGPRSWRSI